MGTVNKGDKYILHSVNGMDYKIEVVNVNYCRPPEMLYACDIIDPNGVSYYETKGDWYFCDDDFLRKCELKEWNLPSDPSELFK